MLYSVVHEVVVKCFKIIIIIKRRLKLIFVLLSEVESCDLLVQAGIQDDFLQICAKYVNEIENFY